VSKLSVLKQQNDTLEWCKLWGPMSCALCILLICHPFWYQICLVHIRTHAIASKFLVLDSGTRNLHGELELCVICLMICVSVLCTSLCICVCLSVCLCSSCWCGSAEANVYHLVIICNASSADIVSDRPLRHVDFTEPWCDHAHSTFVQCSH